MSFETVLIVLYNLLVFGLLGIGLGYAVLQRRTARADRHLGERTSRDCAPRTGTDSDRRAA